MSDRLDEAAARGKAVIGDLLGDEEMEQEGRVEAERARLERETGGSLDRGPGDLDRGIADVTTRGRSIDDPGGAAPAGPLEGDAGRAG